MGLKVGCFAGFCHHHLTTMNVHMHAYCYPLFESRTKAGLKTIALCSDNLCTVCYGNLIIDILAIACGDPMNGVVFDN